MSQTTVLERRHSIRRGDTRPGQASLVEERPVALAAKGRLEKAPSPDDRRIGMERREYVPQHHITVGRVAGSGGWMGGVCSCGEHTLSRVEGLIESWARWHRRQVMAEKSSFVHTS